MAETLLIRADANTRIGTGHVMRSLALAQAWRASGGEAIFLHAADSMALSARLQEESFQVLDRTFQAGSQEDAEQTALLARNVGAAWVVLDGYHFGPVVQKILRRLGCQVLLIDDLGQEDCCEADVILNQNIHARHSLYPASTHGTNVLLGTNYALLRREFLDFSHRERHIGSVPQALVTLGGSDPQNVTLKVVRALSAMICSGLPLRAKVLVGAANPYWKELRQANSNPESLELMTSSSKMPDLMAWADVAVAAGGSTCWELAFMGLPSLLVVLADNQTALAEGMAEQGAAINLGWHAAVDEVLIVRALSELLADPARQAEMSRNARRLVDGRGADRVVSVLRQRK